MSAALLSIVFLLAAGAEGPDEIPLAPGATLRFATVGEGRAVLAASDQYTQAMSPFDRAVRMRTRQPTTERQYLDFVAGHVRPWSAAEKQAAIAVADAARAKLTPWRLAFPPVVVLVKTSGQEEGGAAYCRANAIVFPERILRSLKLQLLVHELFHIFTRNRPDLRPQLYGIVGFTPCATVELPESLRSRKLTNPDAVPLDYAIWVRQGATRYRAAPLLLSRRPGYDPETGQGLFDCLAFKLLVIDGPRADGPPLLLDADEVDDYWTQIGRNTRYNIHPEEILADNFSLLVLRDGKTDGLPTPKILDELQRVLRESGSGNPQ